MRKLTMKIAVERPGHVEGLTVCVESRGWWRRRTTELRADAWGLTVSGDLGGYGAGVLRLAWEKVEELHYAPAGRGMVEGLYAREGAWCSRCVLPRLSEAQAEQVIEAVARRCPRMAKSVTSELETAVGEVQAIMASRRGRLWLTGFGRQRVAGAASSAVWPAST